MVEVVTGNGGPLTTVADTRGEFASFGFRPPSLNNEGDVAFLATLDDGTSGIFVGSDSIADRVITTGDTLDGSTVQTHLLRGGPKRLRRAGVRGAVRGRRYA